MMNKPKLPEFAIARCTVCGKEVKSYEEYEASKRAKYGTVYAHTDCLRRKGDIQQHEAELHRQH